MEFFKPDLALFKETHLDGPNRYFLHAITFCDETNYVMDGFTIKGVKNEKILEVNLKARQSAEHLALKSIMPIVHTIDLGKMPFEGDGKVIVTFSATDTNGNDIAAKNTPKATVSTTDAKERDDRPIEDASLSKAWSEFFDYSEKSVLNMSQPV